MNVLGKVVRTSGLDHPVMPFRKIEAATEEWVRYMDNTETMLGKQPSELHLGIRHRDKMAPKWRHEDIYIAGFIDGPRPTTKKDIWPEEDYKVFEAHPQHVVSIHAGEIIEVINED